jgi:hypothetical protein
MKQTRSLPRRLFLPDWLWLVVFLAVITASVITGSIWFIVSFVVLLLVQGIYVFNFVRCPSCGGRLAFHQTFISGTPRYRFQLACSTCQINWDTGKISDDSNGGGGDGI